MNYDHKLVRIADLIAMSQRNADFPAGLSAENAPADLVKELREKEIDTLVRGCTDYPILSEVIQEVIGSKVAYLKSF